MTLEELLQDYEPCGESLRRKDAGPTKPSPVLTAADVLKVAAEVLRERDEARRQLAAVGGYKAWTLDRAALHERAEKAEAEVARLRAERDTARAIASANGHADLVVQRDRACAEVERLRMEKRDMERERGEVNEALRAELAEVKRLGGEVERLTRERDEALAKPRTVAEHLMSSYERVLLRRAEKAERERDEARADLARVAANRGELVLVVARTVEERDALKAALREMVECGEGCPACGDGRQGGCGCRYERAREALGEVE